MQTLINQNNFHYFILGILLLMYIINTVAYILKLTKLQKTIDGLMLKNTLLSKDIEALHINQNCMSKETIMLIDTIKESNFMINEKLRHLNDDLQLYKSRFDKKKLRKDTIQKEI